MILDIGRARGTRAPLLYVVRTDARARVVLEWDVVVGVDGDYVE